MTFIHPGAGLEPLPPPDQLPPVQAAPILPLGPPWLRIQEAVNPVEVINFERARRQPPVLPTPFPFRDNRDEQCAREIETFKKDVDDCISGSKERLDALESAYSTFSILLKKVDDPSPVIRHIACLFGVKAAWFKATLLASTFIASRVVPIALVGTTATASLTFFAVFGAAYFVSSYLCNKLITPYKIALLARDEFNEAKKYVATEKLGKDCEKERKRFSDAIRLIQSAFEITIQRELKNGEILSRGGIFYSNIYDPNNIFFRPALGEALRIERITNQENPCQARVDAGREVQKSKSRLIEDHQKRLDLACSKETDLRVIGLFAKFDSTHYTGLNIHGENGYILDHYKWLIPWLI